jgi:hypothetical protein
MARSGEDDFNFEMIAYVIMPREVATHPTFKPTYTLRAEGLLPPKHLRKLIDLLRMDHLLPIKRFFSRHGKHSCLKLHPFG